MAKTETGKMETVKTKEILVISANAMLRQNNKNIKHRKEDENITSAVLKVLEGHDWELVPATTK